MVSSVWGTLSLRFLCFQVEGGASGTQERSWDIQIWLPSAVEVIAETTGGDEKIQEQC